MRKSEGLKTFRMLLDIRDERIREEEVVVKNGKTVVVDVVPSIKERREACKLILAYCWGTPVQQGVDELERRIIELEKRLAGARHGALQ